MQHAATRARCHARERADLLQLERRGDARGRARAGGLARAVGDLLESGDAVVERQAHIDEGTCEGEQGHEKAAPVRTHVVCAHGSCGSHAHASASAQGSVGGRTPNMMRTTRTMVTSSVPRAMVPLLISSSTWSCVRRSTFFVMQRVNA